LKFERHRATSSLTQTVYRSRPKRPPSSATKTQSQLQFRLWCHMSSVGSRQWWKQDQKVKTKTS